MRGGRADISMGVRIQDPETEAADEVFTAWRGAMARLHRPPVLNTDLTSLAARIPPLWERYRCSTASDEMHEEVYKAAYALAHSALDEMGHKAVVGAFRDSLWEALRIRLVDVEAVRRATGFFNVLNDAYWQAYADTLKRTIRNQAAENIAKELRVAKYIQQYLLPRQIPHIEGYEFAGRLLPASEVGGDYWSVKFYPEDGIVTWKLADIAGHGIASATLVAAVKFISGGYYQGAKTASAVMQKTNHVLVKETPSDILVTMVYGWLHPESGDINIVNAGHSPVFIQRGDICMDIEPTGPVLGLAESRYGERRLHLHPDDIVFTCSDGITEARRGKEIFGVERVKAVVAEKRHLPADALIDAVIQAAEDFSGGATDDMSAVVIRVRDGHPTGWRLTATNNGIE